MSTTENAKRPGTTKTKQSNTTAAGSPKPEVASLDTPAHLEAAPASPPGQPQAPKRKATYEERVRRLPPIVQVRRKLQSTITRFANLAVEVRAWRNAPDLSEAATRVEASLAGMLAEAMTTSDAFQPDKERAASRPLPVGARVALREKFGARYEGVVDPEERASLEVVATTRGHVSVKTATGLRLVLARGHVA